MEYVFVAVLGVIAIAVFCAWYESRSSKEEEQSRLNLLTRGWIGMPDGRIYRYIDRQQHIEKELEFLKQAFAKYKKRGRKPYKPRRKK